MLGLSSNRPADSPAGEPLRLALLGRFAMTVGGAPWKFTAPPKALPLLAYLLLHRGETLRRDRLSFLLWPDSDAAEAKTNLRRHLHSLLRALPPGGTDPWIKTDAQTVSWNAAAPFSLDVWEFVELSSSDDTRAEAVTLYRGDLLEEIFADDWLIPERERLRNVQFANLRALVLRCRIARDHARALQYAEQMLAMDPWREDAVRHVMSVRDEVGDRAGALAEFDRFRALLQAELGVDPMPETIALHESIRDQSRVFAAGNDGPATERDTAAAARDAEFAFVGRDDELASLRSSWLRAMQGNGTALLLGGEAGIGKTRLAGVLAQTASAEGARVLWGRTGSVEAAPYEAMLDALRSGLRLLETAQLDDVWLSSVASLLPQLRARRPELPPLSKIAPEHEQTRVFETFGRAFEAIARARPLLLILEDLHWAGRTTIALFEHLVRRIAQSPILIVATFREEEIAGDHPLRDLRRRATRERMIATIPLGPLTLADLRQLVAAAPDAPDGLALRLFTESGGNPFYFGELLRSRDEGDQAAAAPYGATIATTIAARFERLSAQARSVARFASIIGNGFDLEVLVAASGWTEADVMGRLHELIDRHIVRDAGSSTEDFAFSHHLMRSVIYDTAPADEARRRHLRVAVVMERLHASRLDEIAAQLAMHFDRGAEQGRACEFYLVAAQRALGFFANDEAARYATRGLELSALPAQRLQLLLAREEAHRRLLDRNGQVTDLALATALLPECPDPEVAGAVIKRRIALARSRGERDAEAEAVRALRALATDSRDRKLSADAWLAESAYHVLNGDLAAGATMLAEALSIFEVQDDVPEQIEAQIGLLNCGFQQNDTSETARRLAAASALASRTDDARLQLMLAEYACKVSLMTFDYPGVLASAEEMLRLALQIGDEEGVANAHIRLAMHDVRSFSVTSALEHLAYVTKFIESHWDSRGPCSVVLYCNSLLYLGYLHCELGRFDEGFAYFARGAEQQRLRGSLHGRCNFLNSCAYLKVLAGRNEEAREDIRAALALLDASPTMSRSVAHSAIGMAHRELGEIDAAIENLERGVQSIRESSPHDLFNLVGDLAELALTYLCAGRLADAEAIAAEYLRLMAGRTKGFAFPQRLLFIAARVFRAAGDAGRAGELLEAAHAEVRRRLDEIPDQATQRAFVEAAVNRDILEAHAHAGWTHSHCVEEPRR